MNVKIYVYWRPLGNTHDLKKIMIKKKSCSSLAPTV